MPGLSLMFVNSLASMVMMETLGLLPKDSNLLLTSSTCHEKTWPWRRFFVTNTPLHWRLPVETEREDKSAESESATRSTCSSDLTRPAKVLDSPLFQDKVVVVLASPKQTKPCWLESGVRMCQWATARPRTPEIVRRTRWMSLTLWRLLDIEEKEELEFER